MGVPLPGRGCVSPHIPHSTLSTPICAWNKAFAPVSVWKWLCWGMYKWWGRGSLVSFLVPFWPAPKRWQLMPLEVVVGSERHPLSSTEPLPFLPSALPVLCNYSLASPATRLTA